MPAARLVTPALLDAFLADVIASVEDYDRSAWGKPRRRVSVALGRRYAKIVETPLIGPGTIAWGFVDLTNGNVLRPARWDGPDPIPHGNLFDATDPLGPGRSAIGPHGVRTLDEMRTDPRVGAMLDRLRLRFGPTPGGTVPPGPAPMPVLIPRASLLSGNWQVPDPTTGFRYSACHFFRPADRAKALCGAAPLGPVGFTTADYPASKADCDECRREIGELPKRR